MPLEKVSSCLNIECARNFKIDFLQKSANNKYLDLKCVLQLAIYFY